MDSKNETGHSTLVTRPGVEASLSVCESADVGVQKAKSHRGAKTK